MRKAKSNNFDLALVEEVVVDEVGLEGDEADGGKAEEGAEALGAVGEVLLLHDPQHSLQPGGVSVCHCNRATFITTVMNATVEFTNICYVLLILCVYDIRCV